MRLRAARQVPENMKLVSNVIADTKEEAAAQLHDVFV
jgi:hypothetical protein